jgi:hypothetical protein
MGGETRQKAYRMEKLSLVELSRGARLVAPKKRQEWSQGALPLMPLGRLRGWHVLVCLSSVSYR